MYNIDGLQITKKDTVWIVDDGERTFTIDSLLQPTQDWFCPYETIKIILSVLKADIELENINE